MAPKKISEFNFGQYDARREYERDKDFFVSSFIPPVTLSLDSLNSGNRFIVIGRKGAGKTAAMFYLKELVQQRGYLVDLISFFDDLNEDDLRTVSQSQTFSLLDARWDGNNVVGSYNFKDVWKRTILTKIATVLEEGGISNKFTKFCLKNTKPQRGIFDGLLKGLQVAMIEPIGSYRFEFSYDPALNSKDKIPIHDFNSIAADALLEHSREHKVYLIFDELVVSTLKIKSDEYNLRLAMIRDLVRSIAEMNDFFCRYSMDVHVITNLRPEVRNEINRRDAEISKVIDDNDVPLEWHRNADTQSAIISILKSKIQHGVQPPLISSEVDAMLPDKIDFGGTPTPFQQFVLNQSWMRPRDMVRLLKCYAKINSDHTAISSEGIRECLNEYSRISANELFDEIVISVSIINPERLPRMLRRRTYKTLDDLKRDISRAIDVDDLDLFIDELFYSGIILNVDYTPSGRRRYFAGFRGEEYLDDSMQIMVHQGLWNYFNIRHRSFPK